MASEEGHGGIATAAMVMRELNLPIAIEFAETLLIQHDLRNSLASLTLWTQKEAASELPDADTRVILGSLFRDGVVQFVGCFEKTRHPLSVAEVYPRMNGADVYFKWMHDLRNAFAAHRYGAARQCVVGVLVDPEKGLLGYGQMFGVYAGPQRSGHGDLLRFVAAALEFADAKVTRLSAQLDAEARAIPVEELLKAPLAALHGMDPVEMGKSRGQLKKDREARSKE